ncbi:MAG: hypothetical protein KDA68_11100 [Planctomycetaceae bacterium]|nr:hypothetical protein [Planctomycetaceae bacterium]
MDELELQLTRLTSKLLSHLEKQIEKSVLGSGKRIQLPKPRVCVMEARRASGVLGWHAPSRWKQGAVNLDEIVLTPEAVGQGVYRTSEVVLHELIHLANSALNRRDTSRQGRYHNKRFQEMAIIGGLTVTEDSQFGWCLTELNPKTHRFVGRLIQLNVVSPHVFKYKRRKESSAGNSLVKLQAKCGTFAYVPKGRADDGNLCCHLCGEILRPIRSEGVNGNGVIGHQDSD